MRPAIWLPLAGVAGLVIGVAWPPPPIPRSQQVEPPWSLPARAELQRYSEEEYQGTRQTIRWLGEGSGGNSGSGGENGSGGWRLVGLVADPGLAALILRPGDARPTRVEVGSAMPDGSTVRDIRRDGITTEKGNCRITYRLHRPVPVGTAGECATEKIDAEPGNTAT